MSSNPAQGPPSGARVVVGPGGLDLVERGRRLALPLLAGSVHYWRHDVADWVPCLRALRATGFRLVDVYVPWGVHERREGEFDFGEHDPRLDVVRFLEIAHEQGLYAIVRPGPHINAELTYFGVPERVVWSRECQARSPTGGAVMLPIVPVAFPVPSYASEAFFRESERYLRAVAGRLSRLRYPEGPVVLLQVDNEGAFYFRDNAYDQDYHPDAIALYRGFLAEKYGTPGRATEAYGLSLGSFDEAEPPARFDAVGAEGLARHLDWVEFQEEMLARSFGRTARVLAEAGLGGVPTSHNLPFGQETTPLNPARLAKHIDLVALDYYHRATPGEREVIARRTTEMVTRCEGRGVVPFAAEMGAGFPPFFPPLDEADSAFTLLCAMAYGLRGFNLYMAVERDRWVGAPIDPHGRRRPFARFYESLCAAFERVGVARLRRRAPVRLVTPRSVRRLTRVMHAFGPATGALFAVLGAGAKERCLEDDLGTGAPIALEGDAFLRTFEQALDARGVPFAHVGGEDADVALGGASWVVCACPGGLKPALLATLVRAAEGEGWVTIGPRAPTRDATMRPLANPPSLGKARLVTPAGGAAGFGPAEADALVSRAIGELRLPTFAADPAGVYVTVHDDESGAPRAAFVINPGTSDVVARVALGEVTRASDALTGEAVALTSGLVELRVPPRTVRFLELGGRS